MPDSDGVVQPHCRRTICHCGHVLCSRISRYSAARWSQSKCWSTYSRPRQAAKLCDSTGCFGFPTANVECLDTTPLPARSGPRSHEARLRACAHFGKCAHGYEGRSSERESRIRLAPQTEHRVRIPHRHGLKKALWFLPPVDVAVKHSLDFHSATDGFVEDQPAVEGRGNDEETHAL